MITLGPFLITDPRGGMGAALAFYIQRASDAQVWRADTKQWAPITLLWPFDAAAASVAMDALGIGNRWHRSQYRGLLDITSVAAQFPMTDRYCAWIWDLVECVLIGQKDGLAPNVVITGPAILTPASLAGPWSYGAKTCQISAMGAVLTLSNDQGQISPGILSADGTTLTATAWGLTGALSGASPALVITWSNGTVWSQKTAPGLAK